MLRSSATAALISLTLCSVMLAGQHYRLGDDVVPRFQEVALKLDPDQETYSGSVRVELEVRKPTERFRFHAEEMNLSRVELQGSSKTIPLTHQAGERALIHVTTSEPLKPGRYTLSIDFTNEFDKRAVGLYKMTSEQRGYAFTQFEATDARKAFPSWDEPGFKIPYQFTISVPASIEIVTNTPVEKQAEAEGWKTIVFAKTKPLPTYLLAIAAGPLEFVPISGLSIPGRIVTTKGQSHLAARAVSLTPPILEALESYFAGKYPYEKLDLIAIPEYWPGAMEHPGAVTFAENILLQDEKASGSQRRTLARVIAHELAHMWFGDLVTMKWWDDLWLNESFADWLGDKITDQVYPQFRLQLAELQGIQGTMSQDARPTTEAIRQPVDSPETALNEVGLAYNKGKAVLGMFEQYIGTEAFRKGVLRYIKENAWGNAEAADLWRALAKEGRTQLPSALSTFVDQPGLPLIEARVGPRGQVVLTQKRFLNDGVSAKPLTWKVPVALKFSDGNTTRTRTVLLEEPRQSVDLGAKVAWVYPHADAVGYYRWSVAPEMMMALARSSRQNLNTPERVSFIGNLSALLDAGAISGDVYLATLAEFAEDPEPQVISGLVGAVQKIKLTFVTRDLEHPFGAYVRKILGPALRRFGTKPREGEEETIGISRPQLIGWLADEGKDPAVIAEARAMAAAFMKDRNAVDPALISPSLQIAAREGDRALFDEYRKRFEEARNPADRARFLMGLGAFRTPVLREAALRYALEGPLRANEIFIVAFSQADSSAGRDELYRWLTENYGAVTKRLPPAFIPGMPLVAAGCEPERVAAARKFFAEPSHRVEGTDKELEKVASQVSDCARLRQRESKAVGEYLRASN